MKTTATGDIEWSVALGGEEAFYGYDMVETQTNGFIVLATSSAVDASYLFKLHANGTSEDNYIIGGGKLDQLEQIIATSDGGYLLSGRSKTPESFGWDMISVKLKEDLQM